MTVSNVALDVTLTCDGADHAPATVTVNPTQLRELAGTASVRHWDPMSDTWLTEIAGAAAGWTVNAGRRVFCPEHPPTSPLDGIPGPLYMFDEHKLVEGFYFIEEDAQGFRWVFGNVVREKLESDYTDDWFPTRREALLGAVRDWEENGENPEADPRAKALHDKLVAAAAQEGVLA